MSGWPDPRDNAIVRARRVAAAYRHYLAIASPVLCRELDETMRTRGQWWIVPRTQVYQDDDAITADLAAELVSKSEGTIRRWAATPHPDMPGRMLLPRHGWDGSRRTYLVGDVREAAHVAETRRHN